MSQISRYAPVVLLLAIYGVFMVATNHRLTILDDEATIITVANNSVQATMHAFLNGNGQHEHPPLSDLFLHAWLRATHYSLAWVRVFSVVFYVTGLAILAACARHLGNVRTYWATLLFATLWPFGYFYARIAGWYCFCFFLVSLALYVYFHLLAQPTRRSWVAFTGIAVLLLWSNYYSVAVLLIFFADFLFFRRHLLRRDIGPLLIAAAVMLLSFLPLLRALFADAHASIKPGSVPFVVNVARFGYILFALLASVAVAPWFLLWSIPIALAGSVLLALLLIHQASRRHILAFLCLLVGLAFADHLDLKRLLFLTPWLMLAVALLCSTASRARASMAIACLSVIFLLGWIGIATGRHPATRNFYEPWQKVADDTVALARQSHATVLSNSVLYIFYLNYAVGLQGHPTTSGVNFGEPLYRSRGVDFLQDLSLKHPVGTVIVAEGVSRREHLDQLESTIQQLSSQCRLLSSQKTTPDPAADFKKLLGPAIPILPFRVNVDVFDCGQHATGPSH